MRRKPPCVTREKLPMKQQHVVKDRNNGTNALKIISKIINFFLNGVDIRVSLLIMSNINKSVPPSTPSEGVEIA